MKWRDLSIGDPVPRPVEGAGAGVKTGAAPRGSGIFVVDLDGPEAEDAWHALGGYDESDHEPMIIETPRGWHLYFEHPGFHVKTSAGEIAKGIDVRGDGGFVVAPGSPHRSGTPYGDSRGELGPAPRWLLEWLQAQPAPTEAQTYEGDVDGEERERRRDLYARYLRDEAPARGPERRGQGDATLFEVVQRGAYDLALPVDDVLELVREHYDPRCSPMWGDELEERVHHKANDAKTNSTRPACPPLPADLEHLAGGVEELVINNSQKPEIVGISKGTLGERWGGWSEPLLPPTYLLEGLIPEGKVVTFFAEGGSVKTWSALALAISVATGAPWLGRYPVRKGKALYLDYEDGPYEVARRVRMLTDGADVPDLGYLYGGPNIDQLELWKTLAQKVIDEGIALVVVDSLGAGMPGDADENTTAFAQGMKIAGRFTETGCTVVFVHHANKTGGMRGTSAARDQSDVVFRFEAVSETDDTKRMRMVCDKPGPQKRPAPVNVELTDDGLTTFDDEANDVGRNADTHDELQAAVLLALQSRPMGVEALRVHLTKGKARVQDAVAVLLERRQIFRGDEGYELDDPARRRNRVLRAADGFVGTKAALASKARVTVGVVEGMLEDGTLLERVKGQALGFILRA